MSQAASPAPLEESIGYVLKQAATALHTSMDRVLRRHGLTLSQYSCLEQLSRRPDQSNAELARGTFVTPQSMNEVLRGLQARELVERPAEATTGRVRPTRLTPTGTRMVEEARRALEPVEQAMLDALPGPEQQQMLIGLRSIIRSLEHADQADRPLSEIADRSTRA